jgi:hypothetical protein
MLRDGDSSAVSFLSDSTCRISFFVDHAPERYKLPDSLAAALGIQTETKCHILSALFVYIRVRCILIILFVHLYLLFSSLDGDIMAEQEFARHH